MKKGFTLIELLSVIVILAVITLIAVPVISGIITKVRLNALKSSAYGLLEATNLYHAQYSNDKSVRFDIDKNTVTSNDTDKLLTYNGDVKEGTVIINKKGETSLCITDGKNSVYKNYKDERVIEAANQKCTIPSSTYVVYLDNTATLSELSNQELTDLVSELREEVNTLKTNLETVSSVAGSSTIDKIYPVGSVYITTTEDTAVKVQNKFGGTWVVYGDGKFLKSSTGTSEQTGGHNSVTLTSSQIPSLTISGSTVSTTTSTMNLTANTAGGHTHRIDYSNGSGNNSNFQLGGAYAGSTDGISTNGAHTHSVTGSVTIPSLTVNSSYSNNSQTTVNVQNEYITVYMYKRTA